MGIFDGVEEKLFAGEPAASGGGMFSGVADRLGLLPPSLPGMAPGREQRQAALQARGDDYSLNQEFTPQTFGEKAANAGGMYADIVAPYYDFIAKPIERVVAPLLKRDAAGELGDAGEAFTSVVRKGMQQGAGWLDVPEAATANVPAFGDMAKTVLRPIAGAVREVAEDPMFARSPSSQSYKNHKFYVAGLSELIPQLAAQYGMAQKFGQGEGIAKKAMAWAGPAALSEFGNTFTESRNNWLAQGAAPDDAESAASLEALLYGTASFVLEQAGGAAAFAKFPNIKKELMKNLMRRVAKTGVGALGEGLTEAAQELAGMVVSWATGSNKNAFEGAGERILGSAALGSIAGGAIAGLDGLDPPEQAKPPGLPTRTTASAKPGPSQMVNKYIDGSSLPLGAAPPISGPIPGLPGGLAPNLRFQNQPDTLPQAAPFMNWPKLNQDVPQDFLQGEQPQPATPEIVPTIKPLETAPPQPLQPARPFNPPKVKGKPEDLAGAMQSVLARPPVQQQAPPVAAQDDGDLRGNPEDLRNAFERFAPQAGEQQPASPPPTSQTQPAAEAGAKAKQRLSALRAARISVLAAKGGLTADYTVSTEDKGDLTVKVIRSKDGSVAIFTDENTIEYNAKFSEGKSDEALLKYTFEPVGFSKATPSGVATAPTTFNAAATPPLVNGTKTQDPTGATPRAGKKKTVAAAQPGVQNTPTQPPRVVGDLRSSETGSVAPPPADSSQQPTQQRPQAATPGESAPEAAPISGQKKLTPIVKVDKTATGWRVDVGGEGGEIVGNAFGRPKVKFDSGKTRVVNPSKEQISRVEDADPQPAAEQTQPIGDVKPMKPQWVLERERENRERRARAKADAEKLRINDRGEGKKPNVAERLMAQADKLRQEADDIKLDFRNTLGAGPGEVAARVMTKAEKKLAANVTWAVAKIAELGIEGVERFNKFRIEFAKRMKVMLDEKNPAYDPAAIKEFDDEAIDVYGRAEARREADVKWAVLEIAQNGLEGKSRLAEFRAALAERLGATVGNTDFVKYAKMIHAQAATQISEDRAKGGGRGVTEVNFTNALTHATDTSKNAETLRLSMLAASGDMNAARQLNDMAIDAVKGALAHLPVKVTIRRGDGRYMGTHEPTLAIHISHSKDDQAGIIAALDRLADKFDQAAYYVRVAPDANTGVGHVYGDGSSNIAVYRFTGLPQEKLVEIAGKAELKGFTLTPGTLETYYPPDGDLENEKQFIGAAEEARRAVEEGGGRVGKTVGRFWDRSRAVRDEARRNGSVVSAPQTATQKVDQTTSDKDIAPGGREDSTPDSPGSVVKKPKATKPAKTDDSPPRKGETRGAFTARVKAANPGMTNEAAVRRFETEGYDEKGNPNNEISTAKPDAQNATQGAVRDWEKLLANFERFLSDKKKANAFIAAIEGWVNKDTPGRKKIKRLGYPYLDKLLEGAKTTEEKFDRIADLLRDNYLFLHDMMDPELAARAKLWYDGANKITHVLAERYNLSQRQVAAVLALMSPQKDWFMNVSLAHRIIDIWVNHQDAQLFPEMRDYISRRKEAMDKTAKKNFEKSKKSGTPLDSATDTFNKAMKESEFLEDRLLQTENLTFRELLESDNKLLAAEWLRAYSETIHSPSYRIIAPEGSTAAWQTNKKNKTERRIGWGSHAGIAKALDVLASDDQWVASDALGTKHKIRNFYNNIISPNSKLGHATSDTHNVAAGLMRGLSGSDLEVAHNFGGGGVSGSAETGISGTYALFHEGLRRAAELRGLLPREMQSITWEAVRSLFPDVSKRDIVLMRAVDEIWRDAKSPADARLAVWAKMGSALQPMDWAGEPSTGVFDDTFRLREKGEKIVVLLQPENVETAEEGDLDSGEDADINDDEAADVNNDTNEAVAPAANDKPPTGKGKGKGVPLPANKARGAVSFGRPDLANPAEDYDGRLLVDVVDEARNKAGKPERSNGEDVNAEAEARIATPQGRAKERARLLEAAKSGATFGEVDTLIAKKIVASEALVAAKNGDRAGMLSAAHIINAWRDLGAAQARAFRQRFDPLMSFKERMQHALATLMLTPSRADLARIDAAKAAGDMDKVDKILAKHVATMDRVKTYLRKAGVDIDAMLEAETGELDDITEAFGKDMHEYKKRLKSISDLKAKNLISKFEKRLAKRVEQLAKNAGNAEKIEKLMAEQDADVKELLKQINATNLSRIEGLIKAKERRYKELMDRLIFQAPNAELIEAYRDQMAAEEERMKSEYAKIIRGTDPGNIDKIFADHQKRVDKLNEKLAEKMFLHAEFVDEVNATKEAFNKQIEQLKGRLKDISKQKADAKRMLESLRDQILSKQAKIAGGAQLAVDRYKLAHAMRELAAAKTSVWDASFEYYLSSILSAVGTHAVNITGNMASIGWDFSVQRATEMLTNLIYRDPTAAQFGEIAPMAKAVFPALHLAASNAIIAFRLERTILEDEVGVMGESQVAGAGARGAIRGKWGRAVRLPLRALTAADEFFTSFAARMEVAARAYRKGKAAKLKGDALADFIQAETLDMDSDSWIEAVNYAKELTFRGDTGKIGAGVGALRRITPGVRYAIPFLNTPLNIIQTGIRKSPMGAIAMGSRIGRQGLVALGADTSGWSYSKHDANRHTAEQVLALAAVAALAPFILGGDDEDGEEPYIRITGTTPYGLSNQGEIDLAARYGPDQNIIIGGVAYPYGRIEPLATTLTVIVDGLNEFKLAKNGKDAEAAVVSMFNHTLAQIGDKTFLESIGDFLDATRSTEDFVDFGKKFAVGWVPNVERSTVRAADPYVRGSKFQSMAYKAFPDSSLAPPPKIDLWGRPMLKSEITGYVATDFLFRLTSPVQVQRMKQDFPMHLDRMITNWNTQNPSDADRFTPTLPKPDYTVDGVKKTMTAAEYNRFLREAGTNSAERLRWDLAESDFAHPTLDDIKAIESAIRDARAEAKAAMGADDVYSDGEY